ncbi:MULTISPECIES: hypothetical protein [Streptomyces]|uniref:Uncharacterized protein n=1 Tax=Streptomyces solicathayae TaxID=3081768 RepID=A0ABZ0LSS2_9ACTN|nr:hypothetical protein [Streptomyces sp. HUAS YS2]WOX22540.1 hypothetical protein R2D22_14495 [Streptomyces sp. HUAS YS2]
MSEPNPYKSDDGGYQWGPDQQPGVPGYGYPQQTPMPGAPVPPPYPPMAPPGTGPTLSLGDIAIVGDQIITPAGPMPLKGAVWNAADMSRVEERIPPVAIVLAVVFFLFCLLGLLFLLMKEKQTTGYVQVTVTSGGRHHSTLIPATTPDTFFWVMGQINYARTLSI